VRRQPQGPKERGRGPLHVATDAGAAYTRTVWFVWRCCGIPAKDGVCFGATGIVLPTTGLSRAADVVEWRSTVESPIAQERSR
jgi:hypothetical protein